MQGIKEILDLKQRITSSGLIVYVLHLPDVSGIPTGRVRYGQGQRENVSVLRIPDVSSISTGRVRYCRNQNTNRIATESLIHIFFIYPQFTQKLVVYQI